MGCGISRLERHKIHHDHDDVTSYCDEPIIITDANKERRGDEDHNHMIIKDEERLGPMKNVKGILPATGKGGHRHHHHHHHHLDVDRGGDSQRRYPRSLSFREYCVVDDGDDNDDSSEDLSAAKDFVIHGDVDVDDHNDHAENRETINKSAESQNANQETSEGDELVKKEMYKGRLAGIRGALSRGANQSRIRSYVLNRLHVAPPQQHY